MQYGQFLDAERCYEIDNPAPPRPWINYLGNRRLRAFISQNAGGLLWHLEPHSHRISRYHYLPAPGDQPGFYLYVLDHRDQSLWNPHAGPTFAKLDAYSCRHEPGITTITATRAGVQIEVAYVIPPDDDVMLWQVTARNVGSTEARITLCSYLEFGLLEFMREAIGWCYLRSHNRFFYDEAHRAICYDYAVFEAPFTPRMLFSTSAPVSGFECSRDAFCGRTGSLERPGALLANGFTNSQLPLGGHGCGALATELQLAPGTAVDLSWSFAIADTWESAFDLAERYNQPGAAATALAATRTWWRRRLDTFAATTGDPGVDRFINTWNPCNCLITLDLARTVSTDHTGLDGLRYRDTTQDALAVANLDPAFALERMDQVFAQQTADGGGCFAFYPHDTRPVSDSPRRSDNTVWQIDTMLNLVAETGDWELFERPLPFRDGSIGTTYDHLLRGLHYIWERRGPHGLPTLFHADWNDGLAVFMDETAESIMLGMQLVHACRQMQIAARHVQREEDHRWCATVIDELSAILNGKPCWDGDWYGRLILSSGKVLGTSCRREGRIYLNPQSWAVISKVGDHDGRGRRAMDAAAELLDTPFGLRVLAPPYTGIPEPEDPPLGSRPGTNENGAVFCHANTWAIIAEAMLGNAPLAWRYYRQLLPEEVIAKVGADHYEREPYVYASTITGPPSDREGKAGISWLTGTASWMYIAVTHYLLGIQPTPEGLHVAPCLLPEHENVKVRRRFRGCDCNLNLRAGGSTLHANGAGLPRNTFLPRGETNCDLHFT